MAIRNDKIFPNSTRNTRARENAKRADDTLRKMQQALRYPTQQTMQQIQQLSRSLASAVRGTGGLIPMERQFVRLANTIERLSRDQQNSIVNRVLSSMGDPGQLISSWLRGREGSQSLTPIKTEIQNVLNLLSQVYAGLVDEPVTPEQAGGTRLSDWFEGSGGQNVSPVPVAPNRLPSSAGKERGSGRGGSGGGRSDDESTSGPHPNVRILPDGQWEIRAPGYRRTLQPDNPVLTFEMHQVQSSNVYAIGFDFNFDYPLKSKLIIRYKQKDRKGSGKGTVGGPTYEYQNIHPDWFTDLLTAGSKGKWVWDQLRIRGTVAGHQYPYNLIRAAQGYLPRRAIVRDGRQELRRRMRQTERGDTLVSPLANQILGRYSPTAHRPNVGNMDRGRMERGTPNRGR